jgi:hypothetical protein
MEADCPAAGQVALDFHVIFRDGLITRHADPAGSGAVPRHAAVLFREITCEDLVAELFLLAYNSRLPLG